jgi:serine/threonine protein kinase
MASKENTNTGPKSSDPPGLHLHPGQASRSVDDTQVVPLANRQDPAEFGSAFLLSHDNTTSTEELAVDTIVANQYKVISKIGAGGMSHVYQCQDMLLNRIVAIKILRIDLSSIPQAASRFQREAKVVAMLEHDNIVKLYGLHLTEHRQPFIVMEMVEGESLSALIEKFGSLPLPRVIKIVSQICDALALAHSQGVVHRDLKPSNIMITNPGRSDEQVKVLDFGIAKLANDTSVKTTQTGEVFGSPAYMSPEQALGQSVDEKSDQYSLGCMIFEALTGRTPFLGDSFLPMVMAHVNEPAPSLSQVSKKAHFPAQIERTVTKLLEKKASDRFASISEAKQTFLGKSQIKRRASPYRALLSTRTLILAASVAIALLIGWVAVVLFRTEKEPNREADKHAEPSLDTSFHLGVAGADDVHLMYILQNDPSVQAVSLSKQTNVTDAGLKGFSQMHNVTKLDLSHCEHFTDAGLKYLLGLPLVVLYMHDTKLGNAGMHTICKIHTLQHLDVCDTDINDEGCTELGNLTNLNDLRMHKTLVTGRTLSQIAKLKNLYGLDLSYDNIHDNLAAIQGLKLRKMHLTQAYLTDKNLEEISKLHSLFLLDISNNNQITDKGLMHLSSLKNLTYLQIVDCPGLTEEGIGKFKSALPHCKVRDVGKSRERTRDALESLH